MTSRSNRIALILVLATSASCSGKQEPGPAGTLPDSARPARVVAPEAVGEIEPITLADARDAPESSDAATSKVMVPSGPTTLAGAVAKGIEEIGGQLGGDPELVLDYVNREIAYEPYTGALRGPAGTYLAKAGNSVDRALLMAKLIGSGERTTEVRFAFCESQLSQAPRAPTGITNTDELSKVATQVEDPVLANGVRWYAEALDRARFEAKQAESQLNEVLEAFAKANSGSFNKARRIEHGHTWLQVHRNGTWIDLDPVAGTGTPACAPSRTQGEIAADVYHKVAISIVVESLKGGMLKETESLRVERTTVDLSASRVMFAFGEPMDLVHGDENAGDVFAAYTPVLRIDGENYEGVPIILPRVVEKNGAPQDVAGGFADVLGSDFYGGAEPSSIPDEEVMAVWIQVELTGPGQTPINTRSEIFDRLGMEIRLKGSDSGFELKPLAEVDGDYAATTSVWEIGLLLGEMQRPQALLDVAIDVESVDGISTILDGVVRQFPSVRKELGGEPASPAVLLMGMMPASDAIGNPRLDIIFDAMHVAATGVMDARSASKDAVATPFAEYLLASIVGDAKGGLNDVVHVMRAARQNSIPMVTISGRENRTIEGASVNATLRVAQRVKQGHTLFTPATAPTLASGLTKTAWWFWDPELGVVRDEHECGRRQGNVEYTGTNKAKKPGMMSRVKKYACAVAMPFFIGMSVMGYAKGSKDAANTVVKAFRSAGNDAERRRKMQEALRVACGREKSIRSVPPGPP